jgi:nucleotide-binding universal stress UspA family protein
MAVAAQLAKESNATLVLVHAWELAAWALTELTLAPAALQDLIDSTRAELGRWKQEAQEMGVREVQARSETGAAWDRIVSVAEHDPAIGMIVMGTHGRTGLPRALLGSVAEKVVRHAPCSVMVVRARAARRE